MSRRDEARKAKRKERQEEKRLRSRAAKTRLVTQRTEKRNREHEQHVEKLALKISREIGGDITEIKDFIRNEYQLFERDLYTFAQRMDNITASMIQGEMSIEDYERISKDEASLRLARSHNRDKEIVSKWRSKFSPV